ncbi:hypothetical protein ACFE04_001247 [Oxalis oulophora]
MSFKGIGVFFCRVSVLSSCCDYSKSNQEEQQVSSMPNCMPLHQFLCRRLTDEHQWFMYHTTAARSSEKPCHFMETLMTKKSLGHHVCHLPPPPAVAPPRHRQNNSLNLRRALSFYDDESPEIEVDQSESDMGETVAGGLPASCLWEVMKRLPPT